MFYKNLPKMLLCILILGFFQFAHAGDKIKLKLHQPPPNRLETGSLWKLDVTNLTKSPITIYLKGTLTEEANGFIVEGETKPFEVKSGKSTYGYDDFKSGKVNWRNKKFEEPVIRTGEVPSGKYTICISAYFEDGSIADVEQCIEQIITKESLSQIVLISPNDGEKIDANAGINFVWTGTGLKGPYTIKIVEIKSGQSNEEAMKTNRLYKKNDIKTTSFTYPGSEPKLAAGKKYAWQIITDNAESDIWAFETGNNLDNSNRVNSYLYMRQDDGICKFGSVLCSIIDWGTDGIKCNASIKNNMYLLELEEKPAYPFDAISIPYEFPLHPAYSKQFGFERMILKSGSYKLDFTKSKYGIIYIPIYEMPSVYKQKPPETSRYAWCTNSTSTDCNIGCAYGQPRCCCERIKPAPNGPNPNRFFTYFLDSNYILFELEGNEVPKIESIEITDDYIMDPVLCKEYNLSQTILKKGTYYVNYMNSEFGIFAIPVVKQANTVPTLSFVPDGNCCFKIFVTGNGAYNTFKLNSINNNILTVNAQTGYNTNPGSPITNPPNNEFILYRPGNQFPAGSNYVGTICFANITDPFIVNMIFSTNSGATFNLLESQQVVLNCSSSQSDTCNCNGWDTVSVIYNGQYEMITCPDNINVNAPTTFNFYLDYKCQPNIPLCQPVYNWSVVDQYGNLYNNYSGTGNYPVFTISNPGSYKFKYSAYCGAKFCDSCYVTINYTGDTCNCNGSWNSKYQVNYTNSQNNPAQYSGSCDNFSNTPFEVKKGTQVLFNAFTGYNCTPTNVNCLEYRWKVVQTGTTAPLIQGTSAAPTVPFISSLPASPPNYTFIIYAYCGQSMCDSCGFNFAVRDSVQDSCQCNGNWNSKYKVDYTNPQDNAGEYSNSCDNFSNSPFEVKKNSNVIFHAYTGYNCLPSNVNCLQYKWRVIQPGNATIFASGTYSQSGPFDITFNASMPSSPPNYRFIIDAYCGNKLCDSCGFNFTVKDSVQDSCHCGTWQDVKGPIFVNTLGGKKLAYSCNGGTHVITNKSSSIKSIEIRDSYICPAGCPLHFTWEIVTKKGVIKSGTGSIIDFKLDLFGVILPTKFKVKFYPWCGDVKCDPCVINIEKQL